MSHLVDIVGIKEKLFVLEHICLGSRDYCSSRQVGGDLDRGGAALDEYWSWVKGIVSNYTIECAIKLRMIDDHCAKHYEPKKNRAVIKSVGTARLGQVRKGTFKLTLRECSNKIVHATKTDLSFVTDNTNCPEFQYWNGNYNLYGMKSRKQWHVELDIAGWCSATVNWLDELDARHMIYYMGQDWC